MGAGLRIHLVHRHPHGYLGVNLYGLLVECDNDFLRSVEPHSLTLCTRSDLGDVVKTEHHIL